MEPKDLNMIIKELSVSLYTDLEETDRALIGENLNKLLESDSKKSLKKLEELFDNLNKQKIEITQSENFKVFQECDKYQKALQKLDLEIRNHIKKELQMKVYIDSLDEIIENTKPTGLGSNKKASKNAEELSEENKKIQSLISKKNQEIEDLKSLSLIDENTEYKLLKQKVSTEHEKILDQEKQNKDLMKKCTHTKIELDCLLKQYEKNKEEFLFLKAALTTCNSTRMLSRSNERKNLNKDSIEVKTNRTAITPNRETSPIPKSYKQKIYNFAKAAQSTKGTEFSALTKILQAEHSKSRLKPAFNIYSKKK